MTVEEALRLYGLGHLFGCDVPIDGLGGEADTEPPQCTCGAHETTAILLAGREQRWRGEQDSWTAFRERWPDADIRAAHDWGYARGRERAQR